MNINSKRHTDGMSILWISMLLMMMLIYILPTDMEFYFLFNIAALAFLFIYRQNMAMSRDHQAYIKSVMDRERKRSMRGKKK